MKRGARASFVVRVVVDRHGHVGGVVERVATGAKEAFSGMDRIGEVIARMWEQEHTVSARGSADAT